MKPDYDAYEYMRCKPNGLIIKRLKRVVLDEELRHYIIGLATAINHFRKKPEAYTFTIKGRSREARDLSTMTGEIISVSESSDLSHTIIELEETLKFLKGDDITGLKEKIYDKTFLGRIGNRIEIRFGGSSYTISYARYKSTISDGIAFIKKQKLSEEDQKKEIHRLHDYAKAKLFDEEGELIRESIRYELNSHQ